MCVFLCVAGWGGEGDMAARTFVWECQCVVCWPSNLRDGDETSLTLLAEWKQTEITRKCHRFQKHHLFFSAKRDGEDF